MLQIALTPINIIVHRTNNIVWIGQMRSIIVRRFILTHYKKPIFTNVTISRYLKLVVWYFGELTTPGQMLELILTRFQRNQDTVALLLLLLLFEAKVKKVQKLGIHHVPSNTNPCPVVPLPTHLYLAVKIRFLWL